MRCLERMLRRAELPMSYSQGYNPRPKLVFPLPLGLGVEGRREPLELSLTEPLSAQETARRLQAQAPEGLRFLEGPTNQRDLAPGRAGHPVWAVYSVRWPERSVASTDPTFYDGRLGPGIKLRLAPGRTLCAAPDPCRVEHAIASLLQAPTAPLVRSRPDRPHDQPVTIDLKESLLDLRLDYEPDPNAPDPPATRPVLRFTLRALTQGAARAEELLAYLDALSITQSGGVLSRDDVTLADELVESPSSSPTTNRDNPAIRAGDGHSDVSDDDRDLGLDPDRV